LRNTIQITGTYRRFRRSAINEAWRRLRSHCVAGDGGIRALRAALKLLLRRFGLRALKVEQATDHRARVRQRCAIAMSALCQKQT
jgi:hypothetical protein